MPTDRTQRPAMGFVSVGEHMKVSFSFLTTPSIQSYAAFMRKKRSETKDKKENRDRKRKGNKDVNTWERAIMYT